MHSIWYHSPHSPSQHIAQSFSLSSAHIPQGWGISTCGETRMGWITCVQWRVWWVILFDFLAGTLGLGWDMIGSGGFCWWGWFLNGGIGCECVWLGEDNPWPVPRLADRVALLLPPWVAFAGLDMGFCTLLKRRLLSKVARSKISFWGVCLLS